MNENTRFVYENQAGRLEFSFDGPFWISDMDGVSSVDIDITESRSVWQVGSSISAQSVQPRVISVDGVIYEPLAANRKKMLDVIAPQTPATLTMIQGEENWYLDVAPQKTPEIAPGNGLQPFQMDLYAAYPYWRTTASYATQIAGLTALFKFPFFTGGAWWISKFGESYYSTITNRGNVPIEFSVIFTARGNVGSPELFDVNTRKKIRISKTMEAGEKIVVTTSSGRRGAVLTGADGLRSNAFRYLSIDSDLDMALEPGENLLRIGADANRENLSVRVEAAEGVRSGV